MATKRTPLRREGLMRITPEAVTAFRTMRNCDDREAWWKAHNALHDALGLKPWEWPAVQDPEATCPYPAGSYAATRWRLDERAVALWQQLEAAR